MNLARVAAKERNPVRVQREKLGLSLRQYASRLNMDIVKLGEVERGMGLLTPEQRRALFDDACGETV